MADLGTDFDLGTDLSPTMGLVSGRKCLAQAILRRLTTQRGTLERHPTYGFDLPAHLNETLDAGARLAIQQGILTQAQEDERVLRAAVAVEVVGMRKLRVRLDLTDADGPFRLTLAVSALTVEILEAA